MFGTGHPQDMERDKKVPKCEPAADSALFIFFIRLLTGHVDQKGRVLDASLIVIFLRIIKKVHYI